MKKTESYGNGGSNEGIMKYKIAMYRTEEGISVSVPIFEISIAAAVVSLASAMCLPSFCRSVPHCGEPGSTNVAHALDHGVGSAYFSRR